MSLKALIIGLDGTTWNVLTDDVLQKHMPHLWDLRQSGCWGVLNSTIPALTPAAWTSCTSGCHPYKHGLMDFQKYRFDTNAFTVSLSTDIRVPSMWHYLGEHGYRVASVNVPFTYPTYPINGVMISGLGCPGTSCSFTYPEDFKEKLLREVPDYGIALGPEGLNKRNKGMGAGKEEFSARIDRLARRFENRLEAVRLIQREDPVDILMVQFQQIDLLQHLAWPYASAETRDEYPWQRDEIFRLYRRLDDLIGELLGMIDQSEGLVMLASDHGFGPTPFAVNPNKYLEEWGYIRRLDPLGRLIRRTRRNLIQARIGDTREMSVKLKQPINWSKTRAMVLLRPIYGALYLNVKGRQPDGCVEPGAEYDRIIEDLKERFAQIENPFNGEKVFNRIATPKDLWGVDGPANEVMGDLLLIQKQTYRMSKSLKKNQLGVTRNDPHSLTASWHYTEGMHILAGRGIRKGTQLTADIIDIAPTLYAWLGLPVPAEVDGRPILDAFTTPPDVKRESQECFPATFSERTIIETSASKEEEEALKEQLQNLGYL